MRVKTTGRSTDHCMKRNYDIVKANQLFVPRPNNETLNMAPKRPKQEYPLLKKSDNAAIRICMTLISIVNYEYVPIGQEQVEGRWQAHRPFRSHSRPDRLKQRSYL